MIMKKIHSLLLAFPLLFALTACDKGPGTNAKDSFKDATDSRPHEAARDSVEDMGDTAKKAAGDAKDAVKDATN
jgi:predicted small lipoprotein YifL